MNRVWTHTITVYTEEHGDEHGKWYNVEHTTKIKDTYLSSTETGWIDGEFKEVTFEEGHGIGDHTYLTDINSDHIKSLIENTIHNNKRLDEIYEEQKQEKIDAEKHLREEGQFVEIWTNIAEYDFHRDEEEQEELDKLMEFTKKFGFTDIGECSYNGLVSGTACVYGFKVKFTAEEIAELLENKFGWKTTVQDNTIHL